nr:ribonuclease H-like domain, Gag-pre-integrase domain protein [Tanacetum cinerariifolium]
MACSSRNTIRSIMFISAAGAFCRGTSHILLSMLGLFHIINDMLLQDEGLAVLTGLAALVDVAAFGLAALTGILPDLMNTAEEVTETVFDNRSSDEENSLANDRPKHILAKINFVKAGESIKPVKSIKHVKPVKPVNSAEQTKKSKNFSLSPKLDRKNWNGKMTKKLGIDFGFTMKACFVCGSMSHLIKDCTFHEDRMAKKFVLPNNVENGIGHRKSRPVWKNVQRINHQNKFALTAVFIRSRRIPVSAAKPKAATSTSAAKPVNTARPKQSVNFSNSRITFHKSHSPIRMYFYNATTHSRSNSIERFNTAGSKAVSVVKGNRVAAIKASAWNKAYLVDYQEINNGGFVAFGSSRGKIT